MQFSIMDLIEFDNVEEVVEKKVTVIAVVGLPLRRGLQSINVSATNIDEH
jgi:hypothetical protein